ncbi:MAG: hypothetical protein M3R13_04725 [Armatimonadota bacterium]|nr:hypothetical protein [Armatimonadota bacterium]
MPFPPFIYARPAAVADLPKLMLRIYGIPAWQLRDVPKASAFLAFTDETGWLGHGSSKYIKDKADFGIDDAIEALVPIPPASAVSLPVRRLPASRLVVANVYEANKLTSRHAFAEAFKAACLEVRRHDGKTITFFDPTEDWNYQESRIDPVDAARVVIGNVVRNRGTIHGANIIVPDETALTAYVRLTEQVFDERWRLTSESSLEGLLGI